MLNCLAFFKPGLWELLIILVIILVLFGATRLPHIGRALGQAIRGFRESAKGDDKKEAEGPSKSEPPCS